VKKNQITSGGIFFDSHCISGYMNAGHQLGGLNAAICPSCNKLHYRRLI